MELKALKDQIDLQFAKSVGGAPDASKSGRVSTLMWRGKDRLIVRGAADRHWIFYSVHDDSESGTIIDLVQKRERCSLGVVRRELRCSVGVDARPAPRLGTLPRWCLERRISRRWRRSGYAPVP